MLSGAATGRPCPGVRVGGRSSTSPTCASTRRPRLAGAVAAAAAALGAPAAHRPELAARLRDGVGPVPALRRRAGAGAALARPERRRGRDRHPRLRLGPMARRRLVARARRRVALGARPARARRLARRREGEGGGGTTGGSSSGSGATAAGAVALVARAPALGSGVAYGIAGGLFFSIGDISTKLATQGGARTAFVGPPIGYSPGRLLQLGYQAGAALTVAGWRRS